VRKWIGCTAIVPPARGQPKDVGDACKRAASGVPSDSERDGIGQLISSEGLEAIPQVGEQHLVPRAARRDWQIVLINDLKDQGLSAG
jgi:hypothetical protein